MTPTKDLKLTSSQALAVQYLEASERALLADDWAKARDAAIKLAALAADRASKK
ncbi:MAG: hypothetical protein WCC97_10785 [Candidatus Acidiferrales bacterium]